MFVTSIEATEWTEDGHQSEVTEQPAWGDVAHAVRRLDGETYDGVVLNGPNSSYMGIVGGSDAKFVVAGIAREGNRFILTIGESKQSWIEINVGRQENEYAHNEIIPLDAVPIVAQTFFDCGECDSRFKWNERAAKMS